MPLIAQMFPSKYLQPEDLVPGVTVVEIEKVWPEQAKYNQDSGDLESYWNIRFREFRKPMKLKAINARTIAGVLKDEDTDNWVGKSIGIYPTQVPVHGKMTPVINVDIKAPAARPNLTRGNAPFALIGARIGSAGAQRFLDNLKSLDPAGRGFDGFLAWIKVNKPETLAHAFGTEVADLDAAMVPVTKAYLDVLHAAKAHPEAAPGKFSMPGTEEAIDKATGEVIDRPVANPNAARAVPRMPAQQAAPVEMNPDDIPF